MSYNIHAIGFDNLQNHISLIQNGKRGYDRWRVSFLVFGFFFPFFFFLFKFGYASSYIVSLLSLFFENVRNIERRFFFLDRFL